MDDPRLFFCKSLEMFLNFAGQFTLRDMYEQFQNIMKMGPFNQIMVRSGVGLFVLQ